MAVPFPNSIPVLGGGHHYGDIGLFAGFKFSLRFRSDWRILIERISTKPPLFELLNPLHEFANSFFKEPTLVALSSAKNADSTEFRRKWRRVATPIDEVVTNENSIRVCIATYIIVTMVRILCPNPSVGDIVPPVYVVTAGTLPTSCWSRLLCTETWIAPVFVERHCFGYPHGINDIAIPIPRLRPSANYPITNLSCPSYYWLACRQCAKTMKWIRGKTGIVREDV